MIKPIKCVVILLNLLLMNVSIIANDNKTYFEEGNDLAKQGKFEEANKAFDNAIKYNPNFADAYYNKGIALEKLGRLEEAEEVFKVAKRLKP